jgi:hypothetical protein
MALQFKRGLESNRLSITPEEGEFIYTTDQKKVYIGDGSTAGGVLVTGGGISSVTWNDVTDKPNFSLVSTSGSYSDLSNTPILSAVATSGNYSDLTGQPSIPASLFDLNINDGDPGQVLTTDGNGNLTFSTIVSGGTIDLDGLTDVDLGSPLTTGDVLTYNGTFWTNTPPVGGGSGLGSRTNLVGFTSSIDNNEDDSINFPGYRGYLLYKIATTAASWVRIYVSQAALLADASRLEGEDPLPGAGVIAEVITTSSETVILSPGVVGFNNDSPIDSVIYAAVKNKSGSTQSISVTLTVVELEI